LSEFIDAIEKAGVRNAASCIGCETTADHFAFHNLTLLSSDQEHRVLLRELDASFPPGRCVFVGGANDAARRALFHAAAGLHDAGRGSMIRPRGELTAFIPEQPYLPPSTLHDLLLGGSRGRSDKPPGDEVDELDRALRDVGLESLIRRRDEFNHDCNWDDLLSFEERQLLALARALLANPSFVLIDRLESALDPDARRRVLKLFGDRGIGRVVFGRGAPDPSVHDSFLDLREDGSWKWTELH
jgi:putative ATP-binding cassette transporter